MTRVALNRIRDMFRRLRRGRRWVAMQFGLTLLLLLVGLAWTRLPDKHIWQVALSLLVPLLLGISFLELQTGTMRSLADDEGRRVKLVWGAMALLVWIALGAAAWALLDWCDDRIPLWAGYLDSRMGSQTRASFLTYMHIVRWLNDAEWILRWIAVPGWLIPFAAASAQDSWRLPWKRTFRLAWSWRWWPGVALASLPAVWLPGTFFDRMPKGSVSAQIWNVGWKMAAAYVLAIGSWVLLLAWFAVLFSRPAEPPVEEELVGVPVLSGPPERSRGAEADIPPPDLGQPG